MRLFKPNIQKLREKRNLPCLIKALGDSDSNIRKNATYALMNILRWPDDTTSLSESDVQKLVDSIATEIRHLYSRTRTVRVFEEDEQSYALRTYYTGGARIYEDQEENDPDIDGIKKLIALIPVTLCERVRALSGEAKEYFSYD
jgi:hypothetical protein